MKAILSGHDVVSIEDVLQWSKWFETADRIVKQDELSNGYFVSTIFLGLDHGFADSEHLWFETMVFQSEDDLDDLDCCRYETWDQAEEGHKTMVKKWELK